VYIEFAQAERPFVLVDRSLDMLEAARDRITHMNGGAVPRSIQFVQADLLDLPFGVGTFGGVLSMGTLHLFASVEAVAHSLIGVVRPSGGVFLSGLVAETFLGRRYLALLARTGEVSALRRFEDMRAAAEAGLGCAVEASRDGSMGYVVGWAV
jgi:ubiquinone/menaquinone biosynthesis C-methylase UbiE